jgi:hypothetical protein
VPVWQIIVFSYNEDNLEKCKEIADKEDVMIMILQSSRWINDNDSLIPKNANYKMKPK